MKNIKRSTLADKLPIWHFEDDLIIFNDGSLGIGFKVSGIDISCSTIDFKNNFSQRIENLLSMAKEDLRLQVFYRLSPNVEDIISSHEDFSNDDDESYSIAKKARLEFLRSNADNKRYFSPEIYFYIRSTPFKYKKQSLFENDSKFKQMSVNQYQRHKENFKRTIRPIEAALSQAFQTKQMSKEDHFLMFYEYFNLSRSEKFSVPKLQASSGLFDSPVSSQFVLTDIDVHRDYLRIGDYYFKTITLKTLPEGITYATMVDNFLKLPFHFWLSQNIVVHDQKKELEKLQVQRRLANSMASGAGHVSDLESESKLAHVTQLISDLMEGSEKLVSTDFNMIIWDTDKRVLEEKSDLILSAFKNMGQSEGIIETLASFDAFVGAMPSSCTGMRYKKMKSSNATHLMPLYNYWRGNNRPVCLLPNRDGVLFSVDPFAPELPNWNGFLIGGSGSGKSFTLCQLMLQFSGQNPKPKIVWVDNGRSSENLINTLAGEFIDIDIDSDICLNVFDLGIGETKPSTLKIKSILAVLEIIFKEDEKALPKRDKALLEEAIFKTYEQAKGKIPTLSDLKKVLSSHPVESMKKYAEILYSWTAKTAYGKLLDGQSNVKLTKDITGIEVKGLDNFPDLKDVFLLIITNFVQREAERELATPYVLIIDEAHRLFKTESGKDFALYCYRVFRKYNAAIYCITQNYRDFLADPEVAEAIFPNTTNVIILKQRKIDWDDFQKIFDFNDADIMAIKSLEIKKGHYSEFFYIQDENKSVLRLIPDPLSYWICTSDGIDKTIIEKTQKDFPDLSRMKVLEHIVNQQEAA